MEKGDSNREFYDSDDSDMSCRSDDQTDNKIRNTIDDTIQRTRNESDTDASFRSNSVFDDMEETMNGEVSVRFCGNQLPLQMNSPCYFILQDLGVNLGWDVYDKDKQITGEKKKKKKKSLRKKCAVM